MRAASLQLEHELLDRYCASLCSIGGTLMHSRHPDIACFSAGFEVADAVALLRLSDLYIESFEVKDVKVLVMTRNCSVVPLHVACCTSSLHSPACLPLVSIETSHAEG